MPLARAAEVVGVLKQPEQHCRLLGQWRVDRKIVARQVGKAELALGCKLPGQLQLNGLTQGLRLGYKFGGSGLFKLDQHGGGLHLDPLASVEFNLRRSISL